MEESFSLAHGQECYAIQTRKTDQNQITEELTFQAEQAVLNFIGNGEPLKVSEKGKAVMVFLLQEDQSNSNVEET